MQDINRSGYGPLSESATATSSQPNSCSSPEVYINSSSSSSSDCAAEKKRSKKPYNIEKELKEAKKLLKEEKENNGRLLQIEQQRNDLLGDCKKFTCFLAIIDKFFKYSN